MKVVNFIMLGIIVTFGLHAKKEERNRRNEQHRDNPVRVIQPLRVTRPIDSYRYSRLERLHSAVLNCNIVRLHEVMQEGISDINGRHPEDGRGTIHMVKSQMMSSADACIAILTVLLQYRDQRGNALDLNQTVPHDGKTLLHLLASDPTGVPSLILWLRQHGADDTIVDKEGQTPIDVINDRAAYHHQVYEDNRRALTEPVTIITLDTHGSH